MTHSGPSIPRIPAYLSHTCACIGHIYIYIVCMRWCHRAIERQTEMRCVHNARCQRGSVEGTMMRFCLSSIIATPASIRPRTHPRALFGIQHLSSPLVQMKIFQYQMWSGAKIGVGMESRAHSLHAFIQGSNIEDTHKVYPLFGSDSIENNPIDENKFCFVPPEIWFPLTIFFLAIFAVVPAIAPMMELYFGASYVNTLVTLREGRDCSLRHSIVSTLDECYLNGFYFVLLLLLLFEHGIGLCDNDSNDSQFFFRAEDAAWYGGWRMPRFFFCCI